MASLAQQIPNFTKAGIRVIAIGGDKVEDLPKLQLTGWDQPIPFPTLADPDFLVFRAWKVFDEENHCPRHGLFFLDAKGQVRWRDLADEPFRDFDFLLKECQRLLAIPE